MIDPLSAVSLAGTVIEFVDFGRKVISGGLQLYHSADGALPWVAELELVTTEFSRLSNSLAIEQSSIAGHVSPEEESLRQLSKRCKNQADELLPILQRLKIDASGKKGASAKWKSLQHALKTVWKEKDIKDYSQRLNDYRSQLIINMIGLLGSKQSSMISKLNKISISHRQCEVQSKDTLDLLRMQILDDLKSIKSSLRTNSELGSIRPKLDQLSETSDRMQREVKVLSSLQFSTMRQRSSAIREAHFQTFHWIFSDVRDSEQSRVDFLDWLKSSEGGIFWVSGKAGSGKSTLMKYLFNHATTDQILKSWANGKPLAKSSFYFWNPGSEMQKSQQGLFQSLLYGILRRSPNHIPIVCEDRWHDTMPSLAESEPWTRAELLKAFSALQREATGASRFCFFIDGLDEYAGDHFEIIEVMRKIASTSGIKLCVSSRPWNVFNKAFGTEPSRMLMLHELTQGDIRLYVKNIFEEDDQIAEKVEQDSQFQSFTQEIVKRAEGVFLWVFLVVRSLIRGAHEGDEIGDFQRRLCEVPSDLETYFKQMLDSVEKVYHAEAARIFIICLAAPEPPSVMTISYFSRLETGFDNSLPNKLHSEAARLACKNAQIRINARCKDLLEFRGVDTHESDLGPLAEVVYYPKVEYLHRTVRDFLETPDMQALLKRRACLNFDPDDFLANAYLAQIICLAGHNGARLFGPLVDDCLYHAHRIEANHGRNVSHILDSLNDCIGANSMSKLIHPSKTSDLTILALAVQRQLPLYVENKLSKFSPEENRSHLAALLELALRLPSSSKYTWDMSIETLQSLLRAGADPNAVSPGSAAPGSVWARYLRWIRKSEWWGDLQYQQHCHAVELLIRHGAHVKENSIFFDIKHVTAEQVIKGKFKADDSERLVNLMKRYSPSKHGNSLPNSYVDSNDGFSVPYLGQSAVVSSVPNDAAKVSSPNRRYLPWKWFSSQ